MSNKLASPQSGFTLTELIVVILLLGILAVTALPRFIDFQDDAHASTVEQLGASLRAGVKLANLKWRAAGHTTAVSDVDVFGNGQDLVDINSYGWPVQSYHQVEANPILDNSWDCTSVWNTLLTNGGPTVSQDTSADYQATYVNGTCTFTLLERPEFSIFYSSLTGEVIVDSTI